MNRWHIHILLEVALLTRALEWRAFFDGDDESRHYGWGATPELALAALRIADAGTEATTADRGYR